MAYLQTAKRRALELQARDYAEAMTRAIDAPTGLDFAALYTAAKAMADGFRVALPADLLPELDEAAAELTRENLAKVGKSTEGDH